MFCPDCGSILMPSKEAEGDERILLECDCGHVEFTDKDVIIRENHRRS